MEHHLVTIHLIRHEKTRANMERKYIGWTDEPIVTYPILFSELKPTTVYGSDLQRCQQTAERYFPMARYISNEQLRELNFGDYEMKSYAQLKDQQAYRNWIDDPYHITPPNGESFETFKHRVQQAVHSIVQAPGEYVFIVHGGVIRMLLSLVGPFNKSFQEVCAKHRMQYTLQWDDILKWKEGQRCTSYSEALLTVKDNM